MRDDDLLPRVGEVLAGGISASRPITSLMTEEEERHYIGTALDRLEAVLGERPAGWRSPEHCESARTPRLLAEAGVRYVTDWCNDEQPYPLPGAGNDLWSFPLSWELSDVATAHLRDVSPDVYRRSVCEAFDVLRSEGGGSGRVLGLHLHPWVAGQAFRASSVEGALAHIRGDLDAWITTPGRIVSRCRSAAVQ